MQGDGGFEGAGVIKINYKPTYKFSSFDIFDAADSEPITYEAHARLPGEWAALHVAWRNGNYEDTNQALDIIGLALVSVAQGGERWPIEGRAGAEALRDAVEADNPGYGDQFIKHLALGHYNYHFRRLESLLGNSEAPSASSADGSSPNTSSGATAKSAK